MRALIFDKKLKIIDDYPMPIPPAGEKLIKILTAGICNTDIEITKGYMGFSGVLGHEFVGLVDNQRVVGEINCACGKCDYCLKGMQTHCPHRSTLGIFNRDGCFADYITLPEENILVVPGNVSNEEAVFTEPLAAAFEIIEQVHIKSEDKILVLGDGKLGILIALVLNLTGAEVILVGKHPEKLDIARNQGVKTVLLSDFVEMRDYNIVVEATGTINGFELAQKMVRPRGAIILKSTVAGGKELNLSQLVIDEISVIGSRCGPFKPALKALERKLIDVKPLISGVFDFDKSLDAFDFSKTKGVMKVLINL